MSGLDYDDFFGRIWAIFKKTEAKIEVCLRKDIGLRLVDLDNCLNSLHHPHIDDLFTSLIIERTYSSFLYFSGAIYA